MIIPTELAELLEVPILSGAACYSQAPLWDAEMPGEDAEDRAARLDAARRVCGWCRARPACEALLSTLPAGTSGVWAGRMLGGPTPTRRAS